MRVAWDGGLAARVLLTLALVAVAFGASRWLWVYYQLDPWTRDGRVRVDVVDVAPDVSGWVTRVDVADNMPVRKGQPLFVIDRAHYELALEQANAILEHANAGVRQAEAGVLAQTTQLAQARREDIRNRKLGSLVSIEGVERGAERVAQLQAAVAEAEATVGQAHAAVSEATVNRDTARLNLARTTVFAPVDGVTANVQLQPGDYLTRGHSVFGVIDAASLHVDGYFEETKLRHIRAGDRATVKLMGDGRPLDGHVVSIAPAIEDRERTASGDLLANVNPTFNWVRLAQRIPVRIHIDRAPPDLLLIAGRTATVVIHPDSTAMHAYRVSQRW
jgi:RND family efflux transporter MFP subunit